MNGEGKPLKVGWKVATLSAGTASVRYRALLPALALQDAGVKCSIFRAGMEMNLDGLDALVIVKSFTSQDIFLAQRAHERGIRVVFDLCDNIFIETYKSSKGTPDPVDVFSVIAAHADCVVTTTEPLAGHVRAAAPGVEVRVIPDGIETAELLRRAVGLIEFSIAAEKAKRLRVMVHKVRNVVRRVRAEGPRSIGPLMRFVLVHGSRNAARLLRAKAVRRPPPQIAPKPTQAGDITSRRSVKRIVWFGNHGAAHARFGMLDLLQIREPLETIAREFDVELVVVSNNLEKFDEHIKPMAIPSRYVEWSPGAVDAWLKKAAVVVVPNTLDPFSVCKSANRTVLAVERGVPVVATPTPALEPLAGLVHVGDVLQGLRRYLADPQAGKADAAAARSRAEAAFGQQALTLAWQDLLRAPLRSERLRAAPQPQCIVVLHLIQDLDLAVPILDELATEGVRSEAWCSVSLIRKSPRVMTTLRAKNIPFRVLAEEESVVSAELFAGVKALLTVAESNLGPHRFSRKLSELALSRGVNVGTLQHGFENIGLTYDDEVHAIDQINFVAQSIYIWGGKETLHPRVSEDVKARCVPVGCPKPAFAETADLAEVFPAGKAVVGIFENLHWHRYNDEYRHAFLEAVHLLAAQFPHVYFLVKPHHAGLWLTSRYEGDRPQAPNLVVADPQTPLWENHTASGLLGRMRAIITTPSTVALDAARRGLPAAVFAGDMELLNYAPLPLLRKPAEWPAFVASALDDGRDGLEQLSTRFVERVLVPGKAARRIALDIAAIAQN